MNIVIRLYTLLVHLYPRQFRDEFGDEMRASFAEAIADAGARGTPAIVSAFCREVRDLPIAILRAYWRERRTMGASTRSDPAFEHISGWGMFAATVPFMFLAIISLLNLFRLGGTALADWVGYILLAGFLLPFLIGLLKGIPRWCLPYLGIFASLANLILYVNSFGGRAGFIRVSDPWIIRVVIESGSPWIGLIVLTILFVSITFIVPRLHPIYTRIRNDWTLLSFTLYGAMLLGLNLTFEDYPMERGIYAIASVLILAVGAWVYLRSSQVRRRALVLLVSITLAMVIATIGKALLAASPQWPYPGTPNWQAEAIYTVMDGVWMLSVVLLIPSLVNFLPLQSMTERRQS